MNKEQLQKDINELKAKLDLMESEFNKPKQWQPRGGDWFIDRAGEVANVISTKECREFGVEYQTSEQAEWARDLMRSFNRQLAWLSENDDGWRANWSEGIQDKYWVYYVAKYNTYNIDSSCLIRYLNIIYMSEENAKKLCELLKNGTVKF